MGWISEVIFAAFKNKKFVNRGFLNGPFCPIYGFGMLSLIVLLDSIKDNLILLFLGAVVLTSTLEYLTGFVLEKAFKSRWWDYSSEPFNLKGRICLRFSAVWGIFSVIIIRVVHPYIYHIVTLIPEATGTVIVYVLLAYFLIDFTVTIHSVIRLNTLLQQLYSIREELSDGIEYVKTLAQEKAGERMEDLDKSLSVLRAKYESLIEKRNAMYIRIIKAFPNLSFPKFDSILKDLKNKIQSKL
jgi:Predicted membrane protein